MIVTMEDDSAEKESVIDDWHIAYKRGNDFDLWGQPVEAIDSYTRYWYYTLIVCDIIKNTM